MGLAGNCTLNDGLIQPIDTVAESRGLWSGIVGGFE